MYLGTLSLFSFEPMPFEWAVTFQRFVAIICVISRNFSDDAECLLNIAQYGYYVFYSQPTVAYKMADYALVPTL